MRDSPAVPACEVDVVIVLFHSDPELLTACVSSVRETAAHAGVSVRFLFVDNGGGLPAPIAVGDSHIVIGDGLNGGFARAVNAAMVRVTAPAVLLLNPDAVLDMGAMRTFIEARRAEELALFVGSMVTRGRLDPDAVVDWDFSLERAVKRFRFRAGRAERGGVPVDKATGGALFASASLLRELGPFDERFFLYAEDADLSRRARSVGIPLLRLVGARVEHVGSASARSHAKLVEHARADAAIRLTAKHRSWSVSMAQRCELLLVTLLGVLFEQDRLRRHARLARLRALRRWGCRRTCPPLGSPDLSDHL